MNCRNLLELRRPHRARSLFAIGAAAPRVADRHRRHRHHGRTSQSWNPYLAEDANDEEILTLVYPSLAVEQLDYQQHPPSFEPSLAESWEFSEDGLELTFHLRHDAVWSDGMPVTVRGPGLQLAGPDLRRTRMGVGRHHRHDRRGRGGRRPHRPLSLHPPLPLPADGRQRRTDRPRPRVERDPLRVLGGHRLARARAVGGTISARRPHPAAGDRPRTQPALLRQRSAEIDTHCVSHRPVVRPAPDPAPFRRGRPRQRHHSGRRGAGPGGTRCRPHDLCRPLLHPRLLEPRDDPLFADPASAAPSPSRSIATP